ncbi:hypothetical protein AB0K74_35660 [Streptomyces sp. NPDC056159]|uniref:hypothetical protein n=1 Tax=unclassified Streptomyces TaxID=2593676 RepID=UPI003439EB66
MTHQGESYSPPLDDPRRLRDLLGRHQHVLGVGALRTETQYLGTHVDAHHSVTDLVDDPRELSPCDVRELDREAGSTAA